MKKLMIAMSAIAAAALVANADPTTKTLGAVEGFEGRQPVALNVLEDDNGNNSGDIKLYWSRGENKTGESVVKAYETAPAEGNNQYLAVDESDVLTRGIGGATAIPGNGGNITVSTKVQFTAADEAPTADTGDKLLVWAKAPVEGADPTTKPTLCVTDGSENELGYIDTGIAVETEKWYSLEIKALEDGTEQQPTAKFIVSLNGVTIKDEEGEDFEFASMVTGGTAAQTIASIGFKGTGAVDDIVFTSEEGVVVPEVAITGSVKGYDVEAEYDVLFQDAEGEDVTTAKEGDTFKVVVVGALETDTVTCEGLTFSYSDELWTAEYTVTAGDVAAESKTKDFAVTVAKGEGPEPTDDPEIVVPEGGSVEQVVAAATSEAGIPLANCKEGSVTLTVTADGTTITIGGKVVATIAPYYDAAVNADFTAITLTLNEKALETVAIDTEAEQALTVGADAVGLAVTVSNSKLYYGLSSADTVDAETYAAPTTLVQGNGGSLTLTAPKGEGNAKFYKIFVTDVAPVAE